MFCKNMIYKAILRKHIYLRANLSHIFRKFEVNNQQVHNDHYELYFSEKKNTFLLINSIHSFVEKSLCLTEI